jgi:hypothetical protein
MREWRSLTREYNKVLDQIMVEMGQDPAHVKALAGSNGAAARNWLGVRAGKATYPIDVRVAELGEWLTADPKFEFEMGVRHGWLVEEIIAAIDPSKPNNVDLTPKPESTARLFDVV